MATSVPDAADKKSRIELAQILIGIVLSLVTAYSAWKLNQADTSLKLAESTFKQRESQRKDAEEGRANRESLEKKQLLVYEAVVKSLETGDVRRQAVSKALVTSMLEDPLRAELLAVLTTSSSPEIRKDAETTLNQERKFKVEDAAIQSAPKKAAHDWQDWDFDIFWCESSGALAKTQADRIKSRLEADGAKGRLRVRLLPDSINFRPGYQHAGYVIRFNAGEEAQSTQLKMLGDEIVGPNTSFTTSLSHQSTPWYLSAFVCPVRP